MSIGALLTNQWNRSFYNGNPRSTARGDKEALKWLADTAPELLSSGKEEEEKKAGTDVASKAPLSYSRRITAKFRTEELAVSQSAGSEVCYSYQASMQQFEILINVNGDERNYLIKGTDSEGNAFEKEFDPYQVDPENADYTEFTALCLYIQKTEGYADSIMQDFVQPDNILQKMNYVGIFGIWCETQGQIGNTELYENAKKLLGAINTFMDNAVSSKEEPLSENLLDLLFKEQDVSRKEAEAAQKDTEQKKTASFYWEREFARIGADAPASVKQAWMEAAAVAGVDGMGITGNGMMRHISQLMVKQVERNWRGEDSKDILGSSVQSALKAADEALYALEHPLAPHQDKTPEAAKAREREKLFYQEFLSRLHNL